MEVYYEHHHGATCACRARCLVSSRARGGGVTVRIVDIETRLAEADAQLAALNALADARHACSHPVREIITAEFVGSGEEDRRLLGESRCMMPDCGAIVD